MHKPAQFFSKEQSDILVSYAGHTNDPLEHLYYLAISTGAREGELLGLKWQNINWENDSISIVQQVKWSTRKRFGDKNFMFAAPKTRKAIRHIKVGPDTIQRLREQEEKVRMLKQLKGADWQEHNLVFPSSIGTPIEPTNLNRRFKKLLKNASLPQYRFHELRHTHASLLLLQGTHPQIVSERLGHSDIATTLRLYSHVIPSLQNDAALNIEKILNQEI
jgi:integrase